MEPRPTGHEDEVSAIRESELSFHMVSNTAEHRNGGAEVESLGIEGAQGFDFVVQQFDPVGEGRAHGIHIDQRASDGKLAAVLDLRHAAVAGFLQAQPLLGGIELLTRGQQQAATSNRQSQRSKNNGR